MVQLRPLSKQDAEALAALHALCFPPEACWDAKQMAGSLALDTTIGFAVAEETLIGFILLQKVVDEVEVLTLCTHPTFRGQGHGGALLHQALTLPGIKTVFLEVAADNEPAKHLYAHAGFQVLSVRPGYYRREQGAVDAINYRYLTES